RERVDVFGHGGGRRTAELMKVPFLAELPLIPGVRVGGDTGRPVALMGEDHPDAQPFIAMAKAAAERAEATSASRKGPSITMED
ncbi:MAG TPA: ATP-binding protein, partial [Solibacterales bacterium]|nr:ATP-binding protein [Bryobacterales bacterium]